MAWYNLSEDQNDVVKTKHGSRKFSRVGGGGGGGGGLVQIVVDFFKATKLIF